MNFTDFVSSRRVIRSLAILALSAFPPIARAGTYTELYNFNCATDGCNPGMPALMAQGWDGVLYGTLQSGTSISSYGTVFSFAPPAGFTTLYRFNGDDGYGPQSGLTLGFDGAFYGTTTNGGSQRKGTAFKLSGGSVSVLHEFSDGSDGAYPWAPPVQTPDGNLYGVTDTGSNPGRVYKIAPSGKFSVIATLPSKTQAPLVMANDGNFYGTTMGGGDFNAGTVFRLSTRGKLKIVHSFDPSTEGTTPIGPVMQAADGKFYGTTSADGTANQGTVYQLSANGAFAILHNFQTTKEGSYSLAGFVQGSDNDLYSVTSAGGINGYGTLYKINTTGTRLTALHQFDYPTGAYPEATLTLDTSGIIYGLAAKGGSLNGADGVLFSYDGGLKPFAALTLWAGAPGTTIGILGQGFSGATGVDFGSVAASFTVASDTYITATVPSGAATAKVTVLAPGGNLTTLRKFKVLP
ncbi:MAG TPA: choice-of-anchor tandem repeat GloVer-containing protein [Rhizomicrobium sp.]|jgi:uncharacterized repeat protein (TIGR03803 family)